MDRTERALLRQIADWHQPEATTDEGTICVRCYQRWPCDAGRYIVCARTLEAQVAGLRAALVRIAEGVDHPYGKRDDTAEFYAAVAYMQRIASAALAEAPPPH